MLNDESVKEEEKIYINSVNKWKGNHNTTGPLGHIKSSPVKEIDSSKCLCFKFWETENKWLDAIQAEKNQTNFKLSDVKK